ncbi:MAG TPA: hypothetical protein VGE12_18265 [Noviherbaspirillum sp.]
MSYRLEYQWGAFHIPADALGLAHDRFIVAIEGGDNNVRQTKTGKRVRSWDACMIGTAEQVVQQAVYVAGACEGGSLQPYGRCCTPEAYIRRIRRLVEGPDYLQQGWWSAQLRVSITHAIVADVRQIGLEPRIERCYGEERAIVQFPQERYPDFFRLVDRYVGELPAWRFAEVFGLPSS